MAGELLLSLFPGIGLLDHAFELEGFCVVRGPDVLWGGDVRRFHPPAGRFDGIIGGPPCQAFSDLARFAEWRGNASEFGNLIPEFERVVEEAQPTWFLMENVPAAPVPQVRGYWPAFGVTLNNRWVGGEQNRVRRLSFGQRFDVAHGGVNLDVSPDIALFEAAEWKAAVTSAHAGQTKSITHYTPTEAALAQGMPADFLARAPFTQQGKLKAIANGVPIPMGRAVARAVRRALGLPLVEQEAAS